eukprot:9497639-Pyramimonas_sp.AAC.1
MHRWGDQQQLFFRSESSIRSSITIGERRLGWAFSSSGRPALRPRRGDKRQRARAPIVAPIAPEAGGKG